MEDSKLATFYKIKNQCLHALMRITHTKYGETKYWGRATLVSKTVRVCAILWSELKVPVKWDLAFDVITGVIAYRWGFIDDNDKEELELRDFIKNICIEIDKETAIYRLQIKRYLRENPDLKIPQ